jgi:hypothetical protein
MKGLMIALQYHHKAAESRFGGDLTMRVISRSTLRKANMRRDVHPAQRGNVIASVVGLVLADGDAL